MAPEIDGKLYLNDIEVAQTLLSARGGTGKSACPTKPPPGDLVTVESRRRMSTTGRAVVEILDVPRAALHVLRLPGQCNACLSFSYRHECKIADTRCLAGTAARQRCRGTSNISTTRLPGRTHASP